ncbi:carbohydrate deacetylase-like isoform X1 [Rhopilema esculentum]|uniref:carbohydrate deacetylase-like isoform X1 n=1 Tax=Rhopilema esculentum TaxID=499914 RepID=UPI0031D323BD
MLQVKITADDFGYCKRRNAGILELCSEGLVDKLSLLVNAVDVHDAVDGLKSLLDKQRDVGLDRSCCKSMPVIGLHLNLTEGKPISDEAVVPSLLNKQGFFQTKHEIADKLKGGSIKKSEIEVEMRAQVDRFKNLTGKLPSYVDGHQHVHILPTVSEIFAEVLTSYDIVETRIPNELFIHHCNWIAHPQKNFYEEVCKNSVSAAKIFKARGISYSDFFIGLSTMGRNMTKSNIYRAFDCIIDRSLPNDQRKELLTIEFMVHPGFSSVSDSGGCGMGPDEFSLSNEREMELEFLKNDFRDILTKYKSILATHGDLT